MIVYLTVRCIEKRDLPLKFAHVLFCPIKISGFSVVVGFFFFFNLSSFFYSFFFIFFFFNLFVWILFQLEVSFVSHFLSYF